MKSLERLKVDSPGLMTEIQDACLNKQAFLFVRGGAGWVLKPVIDTGIVGVLVWAAWSAGTNGIAQHQPEVERLCRMIGGRFMRFHSKRKGFIKVAKTMGCHMRGIDDSGLLIFEKRL